MLHTDQTGFGQGFLSGRAVPLTLVAALHAGVLGWLFTYAPVRAALGLPVVLTVNLISPALPPPEPQKEIVKPKDVPVVKRAPAPVKPQPILAATTEAPQAVSVYAPPDVPKAPPIEAAPPAPANLQPAVPATPKTVSGVEYIRPPQPQYPALSRRRGEEGRVVLRVLVNLQGRPERAEIQKSSGAERLDDAARRAALEALFKPHLENGQPVAVWAIVPIVFSLGS